jgi:hypothetical protein
MRMVKIHIPDQKARSKVLLDLIRRGRVMCLPDDQFVVPEPALDVLRRQRVSFQELSRK